MHIMETIVDVRQSPVMSDVLVNFECSFQVVCRFDISVISKGIHVSKVTLY